MASTTIQDQVNAVVSRNTVEARVQGVPSPDVEAAAVFEAVGMNLILKPKTVLYVAGLARNGVVAAAKAELEQVSTLIDAARDSTNQTFEIKNTTSLERAKTALLQLEDLSKVDASNSTFRTYENAVDEFLKQQLAKNVRRRGAVELTRPGKEAAQDIPSSFEVLAELHEEFIDRLYAASVGVDNFLTSPMATVLGVSTAYRVRQDLQDIIDSVGEDLSGSQSRDFATRLIASRAALRVLGSPPDLLGPVLDTAAEKPTGYALKASTDLATVEAVSASGPFTVSSGSLTVEAAGLTATVPLTTLLPAGNNPAIYSSSLTFPITVPSGYHLYIEVETTPAVTSGGGWSGPSSSGTYTHATYGGGWYLKDNYYRVFRAPLTPGSIASVSALAAEITSGLSSVNADAGITINLGTAVAFGSNRVAIYLNAAFRALQVSAHYSTPTPVPVFYTLSAHSLFGLSLGQSGVRDSVLPETVADAINLNFSSICTASSNRDGTVTISALEDAPGTTLQLTGQVATDLSLPALSIASSNVIILSGTVNGSQENPFNPSSLVQVGDTVVLPTGTSKVATVQNSSFTLQDEVPTFLSGDITVTSSLVAMWEALNSAFDSATISILNSKFNDGLSTIDLAIAALSGDPTEGKKLAVITLLTELQGLLQGVVTALTDSVTILPTGAALLERDNCNNIVSTFEQRKFDRAVDFFLQCRLHELFEMDFMTASYGGNLMKTASDFARTDVKFPDRTKDEDTTTVVQNNRSLL